MINTNRREGKSVWDLSSLKNREEQFFNQYGHKYDFDFVEFAPNIRTLKFRLESGKLVTRSIEFPYVQLWNYGWDLIVTATENPYVDFNLAEVNDYDPIPGLFTVDLPNMSHAHICLAMVANQLEPGQEGVFNDKIRAFWLSAFEPGSEDDLDRGYLLANHNGITLKPLSKLQLAYSIGMCE